MKGVTNATQGMKMASTGDVGRRIRDFGVETDCKMESVNSLIAANFKKGTKGLKEDHLVQ